MTYLTVLKEAFELGKKAHTECKPNAVAFYMADLSGNPTSDAEVCDEGNCGGAYITGLSGRSKFVRWFKKNAEDQVSSHRWELEGFSLAKGVYGGYTLTAPTGDFYNGQSADRYEAFYEAFANHFEKYIDSCHIRTYLT